MIRLMALLGTKEVFCYTRRLCFPVSFVLAVCMILGLSACAVQYCGPDFPFYTSVCPAN